MLTTYLNVLYGNRLGRECAHKDRTLPGLLEGTHYSLTLSHRYLIYSGYFSKYEEFHSFIVSLGQNDKSFVIDLLIEILCLFVQKLLLFVLK